MRYAIRSLASRGRGVNFRNIYKSYQIPQIMFLSFWNLNFPWEWSALILFFGYVQKHDIDSASPTVWSEYSQPPLLTNLIRLTFGVFLVCGLFFWWGLGVDFRRFGLRGRLPGGKVKIFDKGDIERPIYHFPQANTFPLTNLSHKKWTVSRLRKLNWNQNNEILTSSRKKNDW